MIVLKGRVIDGNGGEPLQDGEVFIEGDKIVRVCRQSECEPPQNAQVIEIKDGTIMPGLIDLHVHLALSGDYLKVYQRHPYWMVCTALNDMKKMLNAGFTSMRECGGMSNYLKKPWGNGEIVGPRIFSSGKCFVQTGGHFDFIKEFPTEYASHPERNITSQIVDGITEVRRESRKHFREGADFLKVMVTPGGVSQSNKFHVQEFCDEEIRTFVEEAERYGTYVSVHAHANEGVQAALRCGVHCIEHGSFAGEAEVEEMAKKGVWYVPTLATSYRAVENSDKVKPWVVPKMKAVSENCKNTVQMAHKAGVKIGCGADFGGDEVWPHGLNGLEIKLLHTMGGFTPMEAIVCATKTSSEFLLRDDIGTIEEGKLADVIVVEGNPLENIDLLVGPEHINTVIQNGCIRKMDGVSII